MVMSSVPTKTEHQRIWFIFYIKTCPYFFFHSVEFTISLLIFLLCVVPLQEVGNHGSPHLPILCRGVCFFTSQMTLPFIYTRLLGHSFHILCSQRLNCLFLIGSKTVIFAATPFSLKLLRCLHYLLVN